MKKQKVFSFFLELQVEDIPARFLPRTREQLTNALKNFLEMDKIPASRSEAWVTCRRIAIGLWGLPEKTNPEKQKFLGPRVESLKDVKGNYWPQVTGFAASKGILPEDLILEATPKGNYAVAMVTKPSVEVKKILEEQIPFLISSIHFSKTMRWNDKKNEVRRFVRPIRGLTVLWDKTVLRWSMQGVGGGNLVFLAGQKIEIESAGHYEKEMERRGLLLQESNRRAFLEKLLISRAGQGKLAATKKLVEESADLIEIPGVLKGNFRTEYLTLPPEIIVTILEKSKIFGVALDERQEKLANKFLAVIEKPANKSAIKNIKNGYERLVEARLFDAKFFWEQDLKIPLSDPSRTKKLEGIVWSKGLGSVADKVRRVAESAQRSAPLLGLNEDESRKLGLAISLYKADLTTTLVGEYPDLAGKAGYYYAMQDVASKEVAEFIDGAFAFKGFFKAKKLGLILAVLDRLDTLLAHFALGNKPGAKEDPLGLKKLADSVIDIFWQRNNFPSLNAREFLDACFQSLISRNLKNSREELLEYLRGRVVRKLETAGFSNDRVEALLSASRFKDLPVSEIAAAAEALNQLQSGEIEQLETMSNAFKRASNILRQAEQNGLAVNGEIRTELFEVPAETELYQALTQMSEEIGSHLKENRFREAFGKLAGISKPLARFFDDVMVMADKEDLKKNRLAILKKLRQVVLELIDPSKLTLKKGD
ncbi:MAG: glycine--tRNA ligase subunit beta [Elusimicrobia bacterium]|nr:glycine--tRNA ligase subunit beta [Elusimicrobiota bacterium]